MQFNIYCHPGYNSDSQDDNLLPDHCVAERPTSYSDEFSSSQYFLYFLSSDGSREEPQGAYNNYRELATLLSGFIMHGVPLLGIKDFVSLSAVANEELGPKRRDRYLPSRTISLLIYIHYYIFNIFPGSVLNLSPYRDCFGNFLNVQLLELRLVPDNMWTRQFKTYIFDEVSQVGQCCMHSVL